MNKFDAWIRDNWVVVALIAVIVLVIGLFIASVFANDALNKSMVGRTRGDLVETFGPPTRTAASFEGSEVIEWVQHHPGYFMSQYNSDGRGGGYMTQTYIPAHDSVRRAIVRGNKVESCEGGL